MINSQCNISKEIDFEGVMLMLSLKDLCYKHKVREVQRWEEGVVSNADNYGTEGRGRKCPC